MTAVSCEFDAYHQWLGIPPNDQPPNHYRLLGLDVFEASGDVIANAADRQMAHVRTFQTSAYGPQSQQLLNELAAARLCLLDAASKVEYDERLRSDIEARGKAKTEAPKLSGMKIGAVLGEYELLERIGRGAIGEVFKAVHRPSRRIVALKAVNAAASSTEVVKRFEREVKLAGMLSHPNIVTAIDASEAAGYHYLAMEYVPGQDLAVALQQRGPLPIHQALDFILQAARGLQYAHAHGVVHRNVKPGNLLVSLDGTVKLLDLALARYEVPGEEQLTQAGQAMGTVDYIAPEQAADSRQADQRSDVYSLGYTMFRLLTGRTPYEGKNAMVKLMAHIQSPIPSLRALRPDAPESLEAVYQRMVAKNPADRYASMTEVIAELEAFRKPRPISLAVKPAPVPSSLVSTPEAMTAPMTAPPPASVAPGSPLPRTGRRYDIGTIVTIGVALVVVLGGLAALWLI